MLRADVPESSVFNCECYLFNLFIYLFCGLFNNAVSSKAYYQLNGM
jgi:hypothetical protein